MRKSLRKKSGSICDIISYQTDSIFFAITETWLNSKGNNISLAEILNTLKDFKVIQVPRENAKGADIALFLRKAFTMTEKNLAQYATSFHQTDSIFFAITETWLNSKGNNINFSLAEILNTLKDFKVIQVPRENVKGAGVALFLRKAFTMTRTTSFEHLDVSVSHGKFKMHLVVIVWSSTTIKEEQAKQYRCSLRSFPS